MKKNKGRTLCGFALYVQTTLLQEAYIYRSGCERSLLAGVVSIFFFLLLPHLTLHSL